jgi:hypothetical protein
MGSEISTLMAGTWPPSSTPEPAYSALTFTLDDFIQAANTTHTHIETTFHQTRQQFWLSPTTINMPFFTYAAELVDKSISYVTFTTPLMENVVAPALAAGTAVEHLPGGAALIREIVLHSRGCGLDDGAVLSVAKVREGIDVYRLIRRMQHVMSLGVQAGQRIPRRRVVREEDVVAFVDALFTVDVETAAQEDVRCPFCWGGFGEGEDACKGLVKQVGCCGKRFGKGCLVEAIMASELCPNCRRGFDVERGEGEEGG